MELRRVGAAGGDQAVGLPGNDAPCASWVFLCHRHSCLNCGWINHIHKLLGAFLHLIKGTKDCLIVEAFLRQHPDSNDGQQAGLGQQIFGFLPKNSSGQKVVCQQVGHWRYQSYCEGKWRWGIKVKLRSSRCGVERRGTARGGMCQNMSNCLGELAAPGVARERRRST